MKAGRLNFGILFIIAGLLFLGYSLGYLPFAAFVKLISLWPVLLIAIGIQLIFARSKAPQLAYLSTLMIILTAAYAVNPYIREFRFQTAERAFGHYEEQLSDQTKTIELRAEFDKRDFTLDNAHGATADFRYDHELVDPQFSVRENEDKAIISVNALGDEWMKLFGKGELPHWKMQLYENYKLDLYLEAEKGYCYLRMADLDVNSIDLNCRDCYDVVLQFGDKLPSKPIKLDLRGSDLRLELPRDVALRFEDGISLPFVKIEELGLFEFDENLVSDSMPDPDRLLILDVGPGLHDLIINRH